MENSRKYCKVCVTGASSYIGSYLIKKLLERGTYIVHATLRNIGDSGKLGLLRSLPGAETRLQLFGADIYDSVMFEPAIKDCEFVIHFATPRLHSQGSKFKDTTEAAVAGVKSIAMSCIRSGTVRRLIYTASVVSASPLNTDGSGFADIMDENCWTAPNISFNFPHEYEKEYTKSKTESEREDLRFGEAGNLEVVSLTCGLVGGETVLSYMPTSTSLFLSQVKHEESESESESESVSYKQLKFLEDLCGKIPVIHIEDTCEAHIFSMEKESISGRFLCASQYVSSAEIAVCLKQSYPEFKVKQVCRDVQERTVKWGSSKLINEGFKYKYDLKMILDDSVKCGKRLGVI